jgi:peroxiredoxin
MLQEHHVSLAEWNRDRRYARFPAARLAAILVCAALAPVVVEGASDPAPIGAEKAAAQEPSGAEGNAEALSPAEIIQEVVKAWTEREAQFRSARFVCDEKRFLARGALQAAGSEDPMIHAKGPIPPADVTHEFTRSLLFDRERLRWVDNEPGWYFDHGEFLAGRRDALWDGEVVRQLATHPRESFSKQGTIWREGPGFLENVATMPILVNYRPVSCPQGCRRIENDTQRARRAMIDGSSCIVLEGKPNRVGAVCSVWLEPGRGYLVRRWTREWNGQLLRQTDVFYRQDAVHGWVPCAWNGVERNVAGEITRREEATVVEWSLNVDLGPEAFQLEFPPGTLVWDGSVDPQQGRQYFVRADGTERLITRDEAPFVMDPDVLNRTEPGGAIPAEYTALNERVGKIGDLAPEQQQALLAEIEAYCTRDPPGLRGDLLAMRSAARLDRAGHSALAAETARRFAKLVDLNQIALLRLADQVEAQARRRQLVGNAIELTGTTVDGKPFDWASYRGKVVLLNFWFVGCGGCRAELPDLKEYYHRYHDRGFEIVGISIDRDREALRKFLEDEQIAWVNLYAGGPDPPPAVKQYAIQSFPTNFLIDREGRVVSLEARGDELKRLIEQLFKPKE